MIDYLISNKKIGLKRSFILKVMIFIIFRDFSRNFLNFYGFILNLFKFRNIKNDFYMW